MEEKQSKTQGDESKKTVAERFESALNWSRKWLGTIDSHPLTARAMFIVTGFIFYGGFYIFREFWFSTDAVEVAQAFYNVGLVAAFLVVVNLFETMSRNDLPDFAIVVGSVLLALFGLWFGDWVLIALTYVGGVSLVHYACHSGRLDWSPMVGYNSLYVAGAVYFYGFGAVSIIVPIMLATVFAVVEVMRYKNAQSIRIALPFIAISMIGILFAPVNPMWFVIPGIILSAIVIPTALQFDKEERFGSKMTKFAGKPFGSFSNNLKNVTIDLEAASLTAVFMMSAIFMTVLF